MEGSEYIVVMLNCSILLSILGTKCLRLVYVFMFDLSDPCSFLRDDFWLGLNRLCYNFL